MVQPRRNWPRLIGSILVLLAGIVAIANPKIASATIAVLLGAALMISGALRIGFYLSGSKLATGWDMFTGLLDIVGAFFILANAQGVTTLLTVLIGLYVIAQGLFGLFAGLRSRAARTSKYWWGPVAWGAAIILLGLLIVIFPLAARIGVGLLLGIYMAIMGVLGVVYYFMENRRNAM